jgi:hypothetical protein
MTEGQVRVAADALRGFCRVVFERNGVPCASGVPWPI